MIRYLLGIIIGMLICFNFYSEIKIDDIIICPTYIYLEKTIIEISDPDLLNFPLKVFLEHKIIEAYNCNFYIKDYVGENKKHIDNFGGLLTDCVNRKGDKK